MGGLKETSYKQMKSAHPERIFTHAVKGMLPKNRLNRKILKKLKVYAGPEHKHKAQKPEILEISKGGAAWVSSNITEQEEEKPALPEYI